MGNPDLYRDIKKRASADGLALSNSIRRPLASLPENQRLLAALKASVVGNSLDVGLVSYKPPGMDQLLKEIASISLAEGEVRISSVP